MAINGVNWVQFPLDTRMKILFVGDLHGDYVGALEAIVYAKKVGADEIIQVGDWGFMWPSKSFHGVMELNNTLIDADIKMRFIDGNHDWHPRIRELTIDTPFIDTNIIYQSRGSTHTYNDGTVIGFLGGAPSIDYKNRTKNISFWDEEIIEDCEVELLKDKKVDILVTHDAPELPTSLLPHSRDKRFYALSLSSFDKIKKAISFTNPSLLVHGHYHTRYSSEMGRTHIEGLSSSYAYGLQAYVMLVDTSELSNDTFGITPFSL